MENAIWGGGENIKYPQRYLIKKRLLDSLYTSNGKKIK